MDRGTRTLISQRGALSDSPVWSADGEWIYFGSSASGPWQLYRKRILGGVPPEALGAPEGTSDLAVPDASLDGAWILVSSQNGGGPSDLHLGRLGGGRIEWTTWFNSPATEEFGRFSPDGRWIAFESNASGRNEVYVAPVEGGPAVRQWMLSVNGGSDPAWSPDGRHLYYRSNTDLLMEVAITATAAGIESGQPRELFELRYPSVGYLRNAYDPTPDGRAVIACIRADDTDPSIQIRTG